MMPELSYEVVRTKSHGTGRVEFTLRFSRSCKTMMMLDGHITAITQTFVIDSISECEPDEFLLAAALLSAQLQGIRDAITGASVATRREFAA